MTQIRYAAGLLCLVLLAGAACGSEPAPPPRRPALTAPQSPSSSASASAGSAMPDLTGMHLSEAKERLSAQGFSKVETVDDSGQDRPVLEPANWVVESQSPSAGSKIAPGTAVTLKVRKPTDDGGKPTTTRGVIPNVVCKDLQTAQDTMQAAGFYNLSSEDATGHGRQQLVDRNWVVVKQSAPPDSKPEPLTKVMLSAVKFGEPTGPSACQS